jgi:phosphoglycolate phosphatase-like HAD superfamily hydrolase
MIKYVGFDKDGTLIDSTQANTKEWGKIIHEDFGIDAKDAEDVFGVIAAGEPTVSQLELVLRRHNISYPQDEMLKKANEIAVRIGKGVKSDLFPDVFNILKQLKSEGYFIFVSSSHQESVVRNDLERTGIAKYVDYCVGVRPSQPEFRKGEPHFKAVATHFGVGYETFVKETAFVGDMPADINAANNCNIVSVARIGTIPKEKLLELGAKFVIPDFLSLPEILKSL